MMGLLYQFASLERLAPLCLVRNENTLTSLQGAKHSFHQSNKPAYSPSS